MENKTSSPIGNNLFPRLGRFRRTMWIQGMRFSSGGRMSKCPADSKNPRRIDKSDLFVCHTRTMVSGRIPASFNLAAR